MHVLFFHPYIQERTCEISLDAIYTKGGFSGTETALIELATYLVKKGHKVTIVYMTTYDFEDNGIQFLSSIQNIDDFTVFDWYCPIFWVNNREHAEILDKLNPCKTKILFWMQCFIDDRKVIYVRNKGFKIYAQCLSHYVECEYVGLFGKNNTWTIGNAISESFKRDVNTQNTKGNWIFHAVFERGGHVALRVFNEVKKMLPLVAQKFHLLSYYTPDYENHKDIYNKDMINHTSLSKNEVANLLQNVEYFIYPLVLPNGCVHHDTFGTVMLEALASGVLVLTWDVACIPGFYGDNVVRLPVPEYVKAEYNPLARFAQHNFFNSQEAIEIFVDKIKYLENNPEEKEKQRTKGMIWARQFTWEKAGIEMEKHLLE
jgi:glycosyltransferase involved in cell wall biosynthesis